jgi:two-component system CheB/CheR fusion protein
VKNVKITEGKNTRYVNVIVKPYLTPKEYLQPFLFVVLEDVIEHPEKVKAIPVDAAGYTSARIIELEDELRDLRENLQAVIEEVETANEELQAGNEEIVSTNEELQSTNEELQSLNEELHTVNSEYQMKIKELMEMSDDQNNYFKNTDIGQIFIDKKLIIRKFTPIATKQINLIETDIGRSIADISTNFQRLDFLNDIKSVMKDGEAVEKEVVMENGKVYLMRITQYVCQDKTVDGVVVNFIDITEVKKLNGIIEAVFNSSPNGIMALKPVLDEQSEIEDFVFIAINDKVQELYGNDAPNLNGKWLMKHSTIPLTNYFEDLKQVAKSGKQFHVEYFDAKENIWIDTFVVQMMDGVVVTLSDSTQKKNAANILSDNFNELKRTSEELINTNTRLEQSNYDLVQFASVASHDLKEPLRKIQVFGNFLKEKVYDDLGHPEKNYLDKIIGSSNRMQTLIEDVLTLSKLSNNDDSGVMKTDLNEIVRQIADDIDISVKERNAIIEFKDLPTINGRPGQLRQLFQNLITNSLKFCEQAPCVTIKHTKPIKEDLADLPNHGTRYGCIEVTDNGIGIEEKFSDKIFGLFQRLNGNEYNGTGLGLAICKKIVENHSGTIKVQSKLGEGATFKIILPLA